MSSFEDSRSLAYYVYSLSIYSVTPWLFTDPVLESELQISSLLPKIVKFFYPKSVCNVLKLMQKQFSKLFLNKAVIWDFWDLEKYYAIILHLHSPVNQRTWFRNTNQYLARTLSSWGNNPKIVWSGVRSLHRGRRGEGVKTL